MEHRGLVMRRDMLVLFLAMRLRLSREGRGGFGG
jgi:hypothetical protein